jgi:hypothetical protein
MIALAVSYLTTVHTVAEPVEETEA